MYRWKDVPDFKKFTRSKSTHLQIFSRPEGNSPSLISVPNHLSLLSGSTSTVEGNNQANQSFYFTAELRRLAINCEFEDNLEDALRDQFVSGMQSKAMHKRLLTETERFTFVGAVEITSGMETAAKNARSLHESDGNLCIKYDWPSPLQALWTKEPRGLLMSF